MIMRKSIPIIMVVLVGLSISVVPAAAQNSHGQGIGQQLSEIVKKQTMDVEVAVESEAFNISLNESENKSKTINNRVQELLSERPSQKDEHKPQFVQELQRQKFAELTNRTAAATSEVNQSDRRKVNKTAVRKLSENARNMSGPQVAEMAQSIVDTPAPVDKGAHGENTAPDKNNRGPPENRMGPPMR